MASRACPRVQSLRYLAARTDGVRGLDGVPGAPGGHTLCGRFLTLLCGGQKVTFHSPGLGCRPPGHRLLRYCQGPFFSFIAVKFHLVGFRPVFPERPGIPLAPSAVQGLPQPPGHSLPSKAHIPRPLLHFTHSFNKHPWNAH